MTDFLIGLVALSIVLPIVTYITIKLGTAAYFRGREVSRERKSYHGKKDQA